MKKIWALEKKLSEEQRLANYDLLNTLKEDDNIPEDAYDRLKAHFDSLKTGDWIPEVAMNNYYKFCGHVKDILKRADRRAVEDLKKELGKAGFSPDVNAMFKKTHEDVFNTFRVVEGEVDNFEVNFYKYTFVKENPNVYKYLWSTK